MRIDAGKLRETAYKIGAKSSLLRVISLLLRAAVSSLTMTEACDLRTATAADAIIFFVHHIEGRTVITSLDFLTAVQTRSSDWIEHHFHPDLSLRAGVHNSFDGHACHVLAGPRLRYDH
jgi:hypothetical protein